MKTKKFLSILLALMMMLSVVPFYASAAETPTVTTWPTATCELGQSYKDAIIADNGVASVPGTFSITATSRCNTIKDKAVAAVFTPEDTATYSEIVGEIFVTAISCQNPTLEGSYVGSDISVGQTLAESTLSLSSGSVIKAYNRTITNYVNTVTWDNPDTVISKAGQYECPITITFKNSNNSPYAVDLKTTATVIVIGTNSSATTIAEAPIFDLTYDANQKWADVVPVGGKAVVEGTETEVAGIFSVTNQIPTEVVKTGTHEVEITFTPNDSENYLPSSIVISVTVKGIPFKFLDENGAEIIPEIAVPYGTTYKDLEYSLKAFKTNSSATVISYIFENEKAVIPVGENEIEVTAAPSGDKNVEKTTVKIKVTVEPATVEMAIGYSVTDAELQLNEVPLVIKNKNSSDATPKGTFAVYADGEIVKEGAKANEPFSWFPKATKEYELKVVYTPTENDPCIVNEFTYAYPITMTRIIKSGENVGAPVRNLCGATVEVNWQGATENFENWVITDANGNAIDLGVDLTADKISFTMPDYDLNIEAKGDGGIFDMDFGSLTEGDSEWAIINIIRNLIAKFKSFLQQLIETFQSIGD